MRTLFLLAFFFLLPACSKGAAFYSEEFSEVDIPVNDGLREEVFDILKNHKYPLDILVVVDSSASMDKHLKRLGQSLSDVLHMIPNYDWQIAFISADHGDHHQTRQKLLHQARWQDNVGSQDKRRPRFGSLMSLEIDKKVSSNKVLSPGIFDYENIFYHTLSHSSEKNCELPPFCHAYLEQPLRSLKSALERSQFDNNSFFRPSADLVSFIVSNEDERKEDPLRATKAKEVIQAFNSIFDPNKKFLSFGILVKDKTCLEKERKESQRAEIGEKIMELAPLTGGENFSICKKDYGDQLRNVSKTIKNHMERSFVLSELPFPDSVEVEFLENSRPVSWLISGKRLIFKGDLQENSQILVRYSVQEL